MPHATDDQDDDDIGRILAGESFEELDSFQTRDLDLGEKASDAEDFEDMGDDDLADDEEPDAQNQTRNQPAHATLGGITVDDEEDDEHDDLFNAADDIPSPVADKHGVLEQQLSSAVIADNTSFNSRKRKSLASSDDDDDDLFEEEATQNGDTTLPMEIDDQDDPEVLEQRALFEQSKKGYDERLKGGNISFGFPPAPQTNAEIFDTIWPSFEPHKPPRFGQLLPGKRAYYLTKQPPKPPKAVNPTKINLELAPDQEKSFRLPGPAELSFAARQANAISKGLVLTQEQEEVRSESDEEMCDIEDDTEQVGGISWHDFVNVCQDWTIPSPPSSIAGGSESPTHPKTPSDRDPLFDEDNSMLDQTDQVPRKRKASEMESSLIQIHQIDASWDDPEAATARLAKRVKLDLNDPHLLVDLQDPASASGHKRKLGTFKRDATGGLSRDFARRYNISNDEAYDLLKENHQSKVRSNLGNIQIEHSLPALRLQYPFYKIALSIREARSFHRPSLMPEPGLAHPSRCKFIKRKHLKGKEAKDLYITAEDLSQADNSNMLLLEYSEEYPVMLSNFGMSNKLINYYRRKDMTDTFRPKLDVGDAEVLLPQDQSPFSIFGEVEAGETAPTIRNSMYRAPIFKHESNNRDFMVISNRTSVNGRRWFLKNISNLHVVGQQFPMVEVPGTHSRKVTDASKKRLRMLAHRLLRKYKRLHNNMISEHYPENQDVAQNRSKLKEFMEFDKDKGWITKRNEPVPNEETIRSWLKPEELCLLESMQVGDRHLQDAGYNEDAMDQGEDEGEEKSGQTLEEQLAPWNTTKNFLNACADKAMLQLHGEGDHTTRAEGFSFIKTSMKGGFKPSEESVASRMDRQKHIQKSGHSYSVQEQRKLYREHIRKTWNRQKASLSSTADHGDSDAEMMPDDDAVGPSSRGRTPSSALGMSRRDEDTMSMFSRNSISSQTGKVLRIVRRTKDKYGEPVAVEELITDPKAIRAYTKRRREIDLNNMSFSEMRRTGDKEMDEQQKLWLQEELKRLERNDKRAGPRKGKGGKAGRAGRAGNAGSPESAASPANGTTNASANANADADADEGTPPSTSKGRKTQTGGTKRRCAACGMVGHIKTNRGYLCFTCHLMQTPVKDLRG
ncbi:MAG: hypothetical protein M1828_004773 [Chrysothrix sp. TS-e1954]|nr:MAG: hypothetical protein M1828_004773 [Chrysothrix sp. TS-e1954]